MRTLPNIYEDLILRKEIFGSLLERFKKEDYNIDHGVKGMKWGVHKVRLPNGKEIQIEHNQKEYSNVFFGSENDITHIVGGFEDKGKRNKHKAKHAAEMGLTEEEYEKKAIEFLEKTMTDSIEEIIVEGRPGYSYVYRYDYSTNEFGILNSRSNVSTYFKFKKGYQEWEDIVKKEGKMIDSKKR